MTENPPTMRRTRFVCVSDTHNASPNGSFKLPRGDVLIHAGDMTNQGSISELRKTVKWLEEADFEAKIVVAGNHDITLDTEFYAQHGMYFHNQHPQDPAECQQMLQRSSTIRWLKHEAVTIKLESPYGPQTTFKIFGSPFSPKNGMWAFGYEPAEAAQFWKSIPLDSDIVVTHTPPKYHCDETGQRRAAGCEELRKTLWRVRPRLAVCGHIHEGRGAKRVRWDLGSSNLKYKELESQQWEDPGQGNKRISVVDLTSRSGRRLDNDGAVGDALTTGQLPGITTTAGPVIVNPDSKSRRKSMDTAISNVATTLLAFPIEVIPAATQGQGGSPPSLRCDLEALSRRLGRQETCVVNAAIMASSYGSGGKKYNKPIVVDIDLPVW